MNRIVRIDKFEDMLGLSGIYMLIGSNPSRFVLIDNHSYIFDMFATSLLHFIQRNHDTHLISIWAASHFLFDADCRGEYKFVMTLEEMRLAAI